MRSIGPSAGEGAATASSRGKDAETDYAARLAGTFFPELAEWRPVFERLSLPLLAGVRAAARARADNGDIAAALLETGVVAPQALTEAIASDLGIGLVAGIDPERLVVSDRHVIALLRQRTGRVPVKLIEKDGGLSFLITHERIGLDLVRQRLASSPALAMRLKLVDPHLLRGALLGRARPLLSEKAVGGLFERFPAMSARIVANAWQGTMVGVALTALPVGMLLAPGLVLYSLHIAATLFFFACVALRLAAVVSMRPGTRPQQIAAPTDEVPVFTVLVALYKEARLASGLLAALDRIVWPRRQLEIKLVCEEDDEATLAALRRHRLPPHIEIVEVPPGEPRTKPKALSYALPMAGGEFVALYDAEDIPHPMQLVEAWQRFRTSGPDLAVVQAPLEISNGDESMIARMFAFEYAGLFRGLLPWLSRRRLLLPLGGTSNHFRRAALEEVGGWDPFNVTEDADLGVRLARFGYRAETISCPTYEPAPTRFGVWLPQRTRWFKGWSQTWLVHMRNPGRLARDLGPGSFLVAQVLFAGMLASVLLHPLLLATFLFLLVGLLSAEPVSTVDKTLFVIDVVNIVCGYLSFLLLGWRAQTRAERRSFWKVVLSTLPYWALLSCAGWRALWQLWKRPHLWEKTPHD